MHALRSAALLAAAASLTTGGTLLAVAPASAATSTAANVCTVEVTSLTSWELQDGDGQDEIRFELGDDTYGTFTFPDNWTRNASLGRPRENFTGTVDFSLWERDYPLTTTIDSLSIGCYAHSNSVLLEGAGAVYEVAYTVTD